MAVDLIIALGAVVVTVLILVPFATACCLPWKTRRQGELGSQVDGLSDPERR